jgi:hypothetical protein
MRDPGLDIRRFRRAIHRFHRFTKIRVPGGGRAFVISTLSSELAFEAFVGFADEELERFGFEAEADPFADAEFEVEREVPARARAPQACEFAQEPAVVHRLEHGQARALDERHDVLCEQLFGHIRPSAV